jgi:hypothetical protein
MGIVREILSSPATVISVVELATTEPVTLVPSRIRSVARGRVDEEAVSFLTQDERRKAERIVRTTITRGMDDHPYELQPV